MMATDVAPAVSSIDNRNLLMSILHINGSVVIRPQSTETATLNAEPMTDRESQVLSLVAEGFSNKLIGGELGICERTVKNHLTSIMTKLRATDRTHAVVTAVRLGWLAI
ncbi:MAG: response regulator transcription factor [SAR202 cluster bacterium]|jgi:DNA-binding NarL/FixJ family response regulator|nr:response regulator transcription factor [SAR202 cluster bacterium]